MVWAESIQTYLEFIRFSLSQEKEYCRTTHYRKCEDVPSKKQDSDQHHENKAALNDQGRESYFNQPESDSVSYKHVSFTYAGREHRGI